MSSIKRTRTDTNIQDDYKAALGVLRRCICRYGEEGYLEYLRYLDEIEEFLEDDGDSPDEETLGSQDSDDDDDDVVEDEGTDVIIIDEDATQDAT